MSGEVLKQAAHVIADKLINGDSVKLPGIGTFKLARKEEHPARNPRTGETINVPAHTTVKFQTSDSLKQLVRNVEIGD